ncbi:hypothetical protein AB0L68_41680 [Streptomyces sp. NPDC052164]|uniref:hypothetical protein n=1 Tax=unclassified Streptomyces TaxID=2593676 RepID=UPI003424BB82
MPVSTYAENHKKLVEAFRAVDDEGLVRVTDVGKIIEDMGDVFTAHDISGILSEMDGNEEAPGKVNSEAILDVIVTNYLHSS